MNYKKWKKMFDSTWKREGNPFIQFLLDAGLDINAVNKYGTTMLSYSAKWGNLQIAEFLVHKGADANVANSNGSKPLHIAAQYGRKDIVKFFLNKGVFVDSCDNDKCTPLHYIAVSSKSIMSSAGRERYQELINILVDHNADIDAVDNEGCTPMLHAARFNRKHMVELFIKLGANLECCDNNQRRVLHFACDRGWTGIVRTLVEGRIEIDLNSRNSNGYTPVFLAAENSHEYIVKLLIKSGAEIEYHYMLHCACENGWLEVVKSLVSKGCDLNCKDTQGRTPLFIAAKFIRLSVVEYLIECGADVSGYNKKGGTMLHYACKRGWLEVVKSLVSKGCDFNAKDSYGRTPLLHAAYYSHKKVVKYLIDCGADVKSCNPDRYTVLHYSCTRGWLKIVKSLIEKGSDVNAQTDNNFTPLLLALDQNHVEIVKHLLNAGADCNVMNIRGETALYEFVQSQCNLSQESYLEVIILFLRSGAYFQTEDFVLIINNSFLKEGILQNMHLCTVALINSYLADLSEIYEIPEISGRLPRIEKLKIVSHNIEQDIAESVKYEIQTKGYCNILNVHPIVLSRLCVLTLVKHYNS